MNLMLMISFIVMLTMAKDGTASIYISHPDAWLSGLGIKRTNQTLSFSTGCSKQYGRVYTFGECVTVNLCIKVTANLANGDSLVSGLPATSTSSNNFPNGIIFAAGQGSDQWTPANKTINMRIHAGAIKTISAITASSSSPVYVFANISYPIVT